MVLASNIMITKEKRFSGHGSFSCRLPPGKPRETENNSQVLSTSSLYT